MTRVALISKDKCIATGRIRRAVGVDGIGGVVGGQDMHGSIFEATGRVRDRGGGGEKGAGARVDGGRWRGGVIFRSKIKLSAFWLERDK